MSTLFVFVFLIVPVVAICLLLVSIQEKENREIMGKLLKHFSQLGTKHNLRFSSQEILHHCVLGVDGVQGKILVVTRENDYYSSFIIDLNEVKKCTVRKSYGKIEAGDLKDHKLEQYLEEIVLHFELDGKPPVEITFYKNLENRIYEARILDQKAKYWETILSKMQKPFKNIACQVSPKK